MSGLEQWLRQPDERDIVPVRGVVMRLAADEIRRLEAENARLKQEASQPNAAAEPPTEITFQDGSVTRRLVWTGAGYALPDGAETLDDLLAEQAANAPEALPQPDEKAGEETADAPGEDAAPEEAAEEAAPEDAAPEPVAEPDAAAANPEGDAGEEDDEDFELPPEWQ